MSIVLKKFISNTIIFLGLAFSLLGFSQTNDSIEKSNLFANESSLSIKLSYPRTTIKKVTNDSTYVASELSYFTSDLQWKKLPIKIQSRGAFRKRKCYFTPLK